jgi:D-3-phosphoglycerate dehydrogenase
MKYTVAVTTSAEYPVRMSVVEEIFGDKADVREVTMPFRKLSLAETQDAISRLKGSDAILVRSGIFEKDLLQGLDALRIIGVHGTGVDQIDVTSAEELGIAVANAPGANANAVMELTVALMLMAQRQLFNSMSSLKIDRNWTAAKRNGRELAGKKLGLLGIGKIGYGVATRARALGMTVVAYDPQVRNSPDASVVEMAADLETLFRISDVLSLHAPLTDTTRHIINSRALSMMKKDCILINTSRGPLVSEAALFEALASGRIAGAALDVFETEPVAANNPLLGLENVIVTPHLGGSTLEALDNVARMISEELFRFLVKGEGLQHAVNAPQQFRGQK